MQKRHLYILSVFAMLFTVGVALKATEPIQQRNEIISRPDDLLNHADSFISQEISQLEIDDEMRDRLRFDPQLREIAQAVRQDIMQARWGREPVKNPVWKRYGAKVYPLLSYYSRSPNETRQRYGIEGIRGLGKPYTTIWLREQIKRRVYFGSVAQYRLFFEGMRDGLWRSTVSWEREFGLDDPKVKEELIALAKANLALQDSLQLYQQFNREFLTSLLGYETIYGKYQYEEEKAFLSLSDWVKFEQLQQPTDSQISEAITFYQKLSDSDKDNILVGRLGKIKAGEITPFARAFFRALANDSSTDASKAQDRIWAIAELDRHGDKLGTELLKNILDNDLPQIYPLSLLAGNRNYDAKHWQAYFLLIGMAEKYPQSKFVQGCREYGNLTGRSYFGRKPRSQEILDINANLTDRERLEAWQGWLDRYGEHSGADDASYFLALSLQDNNDIVGAMRLWMKMMAQPMGDRDALYLSFPHIRVLLDVGLSIEQMQMLLDEPENQPFVPLLQYAIAIQYARTQNYTKALETSEKIQLDALPDRILDEYFYPQKARNWREKADRRYIARFDQVASYKKETQVLLNEQKLRWQRLRQWQSENTPESQYQIATNWAGVGGWKNGLLKLPVLFSHNKYLLPNFDNSECREWWICDESKRSYNEILTRYQEHSENAIALSIYQQLLDDSNTPLAIREKTLFMVAMTLFDQIENHSSEESTSIHPPAGVTTTVIKFTHFDRTVHRIIAWYPQTIGLRFSPYYSQRCGGLCADYQRRIDEIIAELQTRFPQSSYIDDLLFSSFFLSNQPRYLQTILERYPNGDRAAEAKFLLGLKKWQLVRESVLYMNSYF